MSVCERVEIGWRARRTKERRIGVDRVGSIATVVADHGGFRPSDSIYRCRRRYCEDGIEDEKDRKK